MENSCVQGRQSSIESSIWKKKGPHTISSLTKQARRFIGYKRLDNSICHYSMSNQKTTFQMLIPDNLLGWNLVLQRLSLIKFGTTQDHLIGTLWLLQQMLTATCKENPCYSSLDILMRKLKELMFSINSYPTFRKCSASHPFP